MTDETPVEIARKCIRDLQLNINSLSTNKKISDFRLLQFIYDSDNTIKMFGTFDLTNDPDDYLDIIPICKISECLVDDLFLEIAYQLTQDLVPYFKLNTVRSDRRWDQLTLVNKGSK